MAKSGNHITNIISSSNIKQIPIPKSKSLNFFYNTCSIIKASALTKNNHDDDNDDFPPLITKKAQLRNTRRLIKLSTSEGKWIGTWKNEYIFTLQELQLQDLAQVDDMKAPIYINLSVQKHAGFGLSVDGDITSSFTSKCSICASLYTRQIATKLNVWVLPSSRRSNDPNRLPEIGADDPSVIYVKPGNEADLDTLVQDTIRLTASVNETCSESCEKAEPKLYYVGKQNVASTEKRWSRLLELKRHLNT